MLKLLTKLCIAMAIFYLPTSAYADDIRAGFMFQDVEVRGVGGIKGKERGEALSLEYVFDSPKVLDWALKARPYVGGSLNFSIAGDTSYGGAGLLWQTSQAPKKVFGEFGFGLVAHNGSLEVPLPASADTPELGDAYDVRNFQEIEFGSRILFRTQLAIGYRVSDDWSAQLVYEHLSHGKVLSSGSNEGLDSVGIRVGRRF